jgi:CRISPR type III-B/RAMP module RAMP protein Cmr6
MNDQRDIVYYLPRITARLLTPERVKRCKNLGLILDKYPERMAIEKGDGRGQWLRDMEPASHIDPALSENVYRRWLVMTTAMHAQHFSSAIDWRMVMGLGGETVLETDITLHHLYGIPFIPGSALKGLTRAYVTGEVDEHKSKQIDDDDEVVQCIFGSQKQAGTVIFFDGMPLHGEARFVLDIMNPHYPDYYSGARPPTNDQNPVPFLTVTNTTFTFALAPRDPNSDKHKADVEQVKAWLLEALQKYGVGGKTSAGYGYFKKEMSSTESTRPEKLREPATQTQAPVRAAERIRANIPKFREGQEITGSVVTPTDDLRRIVPSDAKAFLRYQSFTTKDVLIVVSAEEAQNWKPGETRICLFVREEEHNGCAVMICQPRPARKKK